MADFNQQVDSMFSEAINASQGGVDLTLSMEVVKEAQEALKDIVKTIRNTDVKAVIAKGVKCSCGKTVHAPAPNVENLAKAGMQVMKIVDESARLNQFVKGLPDSRQATENTNWLSGLTAEQIKIVQGWILENAAMGQE